MALGGFTLADRLGAKPVPCGVAGCSRTWLEIANKALSLGRAADPNDPTARMCEPCRNKWKELKDAERACERTGCEGRWTWTAKAQLEAFAGRRPPPKALCAECEGRLEGLADKEVACRTPGCGRTAVLTPRAQLLLGATADKPSDEGSLCAECEKAAARLKDRAVGCGITSCSRRWSWRLADQLQFVASGRPVDPPPRRMCDECRADFGKLLDRDVRCRTSGCKRTWTWSRSDQLDACVAGKAPPRAPDQMCSVCFETFQTLVDVERPCRRAGCKGTWIDRRGAQLARLVRGKGGDPFPRHCAKCEKEMGDLEDREIPCRTDGCSGTWTWARQQQLAAGVRPERAPEVPASESGAAEPAREIAPEPASTSSGGAESAGSVDDHAPAAAGAAPAPRPLDPKSSDPKKAKKRRREVRPPERRCSACAEFLSGRKTLEIPCGQCGTPIYWPPESQLQTHLGNWPTPGMCGACKRDVTEAARKAAKEALRAQAIAHAPGATNSSGGPEGP